MVRWQSELKNDIDRYAAASHPLMAPKLMVPKTSPTNRAKRKDRAERVAKHLSLDDEQEALAKSRQDLQNLSGLLIQPSPPVAVAATSPADSVYQQLRRQIALVLGLTSMAGVLLCLGLARLVYPMQARVEGLTRSVAAAAHHISEISSSLANSSREQAQSAAVQQEQLGHIADSMLGAAEKVRQITGLALQAARLGGQAGECAAQSQANMDMVAKQWRGVNGAGGENSRQLAEIGEAGQRMQKLAGILQQLAQETQALARNTAAEAASAGEEAGEFGVAAWEIGKLAERSSSALGELAERSSSALGELALQIARTQELAKSAGALVNHSMSLAQAGLETVDRSADSLRTIRSAIPELSGTVARMATFAGEIVAEDRTATPLNIASELSRECAEQAQENSAAIARLAAVAVELQQATNNLGSFSSLPSGGAEDNFAALADASRQAEQTHPSHPTPPTETVRMTLHPGSPSLNARSQGHETTPELPFHAPSSVSAERTG
jgi:methyl-accepting chemotaxis protein